MSNPYQSPTSGVADLVEELRGVATYQRYLLLSLLTQILCFVGAIALAMPSPGLMPFFAWGIVLSIVSGGVCAILLALKVDGPMLAAVFGICSFFPCLGLLCLLLVNQRATARLEEFKIPVGLLGADFAVLEDILQRMQADQQYQQWRGRL